MTEISLKPGMSINEAVSSAPEGAVILRLSPGIYKEKVYIRRSDVTVTGHGDNPGDVVIEWDDYALFIMPDGVKRGTFRSYTFFIKGDHNRLENITIKNTSFPREKCGQCIALFAEGDYFEAESCHIESFQDTLFTGPLPSKEIEKGGFTGPTRDDERIIGRQYYKNCRISGDVDFIFGSATCLFEGCDIVSVYAGEDVLPVDVTCGYCTAPSTYEGEKYGYVFNNCRFLNEGCPEKSVYLGRPWRDYARTVLINCFLDSHIKEEGFHDWNKRGAHGKFYFAELGSYGPGSNGKRADFVSKIENSMISEYSKDKIFSKKV